MIEKLETVLLRIAILIVREKNLAKGKESRFTARFSAAIKTICELLLERHGMQVIDFYGIYSSLCYSRIVGTQEKGGSSIPK